MNIRDGQDLPSSSDEEMYVRSSDSQGDKEMEIIDATIPHPELLEAMEELALDSLRIQRSGRFPFLRRNLRRSLRSLAFSLLSQPHPTRAPTVDVIYKYEDLTFVSRCRRWVCPLCELFGSKSFATQDGLDEHLWSNHGSYSIEWGTSRRNGEEVRFLPLHPNL